MRLLLDYRWPGNVRELANVIEYGVTVSGRETILPEDLPEEVKRAYVEPDRSEEKVNWAPHSGSDERSPASTDDPEATRIRSILDAHRWKRTEAARALGISRATLWRRMRELNLG